MPDKRNVCVTVQGFGEGHQVNDHITVEADSILDALTEGGRYAREILAPRCDLDFTKVRCTATAIDGTDLVTVVGASV